MKKTILYLLTGGILCTMLTLVSCDDDEKSLPKIDGYNNSDEVAEENLVAKWELDGDAEESISGEEGEESNVTYAEGKVGEAAVFTEGYIYNETVPGLAAKVTGSFSISLWAQVRNNGSAPTALAMLTGDIHTNPIDKTPGAVLLETGHFKAVSDTFRVKALVGVNKPGDVYELIDNVNWWGLDNIKKPGQMVKIASGDWAHFVLVWDNTAKILRLYVNKVVATNAEWESKPDVLGFDPQSNLGMIIGGFNNNVGLSAVSEPWAKAMTGKVDQVRVYNTVLAEAEISALYNLEDVGR